MGSVHQQVYPQFDELVDEELAPLIAMAWRCRIVTTQSCQDLGESVVHYSQFDGMDITTAAMAWCGRAIIEFAELDGLERFLSLVADGPPSQAMYERMQNWMTDHFMPEGQWVTRVRMMPSDVPCDFYAAAYELSFPRSDIPEMTECMRATLARPIPE